MPEKTRLPTICWADSARRCMAREVSTINNQRFPMDAGGFVWVWAGRARALAKMKRRYQKIKRYGWLSRTRAGFIQSDHSVFASLFYTRSSNAQNFTARFHFGEPLFRKSLHGHTLLGAPVLPEGREERAGY